MHLGDFDALLCKAAAAHAAGSQQSCTGEAATQRAWVPANFKWRHRMSRPAFAHACSAGRSLISSSSCFLNGLVGRTLVHCRLPPGPGFPPPRALTFGRQLLPELPDLRLGPKTPKFRCASNRLSTESATCKLTFAGPPVVTCAATVSPFPLALQGPTPTAPSSW